MNKDILLDGDGELIIPKPLTIEELESENV